MPILSRFGYRSPPRVADEPTFQKTLHDWAELSMLTFPDPVMQHLASGVAAGLLADQAARARQAATVRTR